MIDLTDEQKALYFRRSYTAVDGLWFIKMEEKYGLDAALELDKSVWSVLPKIQARTLKTMIGQEFGLEGLQKAIRARFDLENFNYELKCEHNSFTVIISRCPWHDLMTKSGRFSLSERISSLICEIETSVWSSEFSDDSKIINWTREKGICKGNKNCVMKFSECGH